MQLASKSTGNLVSYSIPTPKQCSRSYISNLNSVTQPPVKPRRTPTSEEQIEQEEIETKRCSKAWNKLKIKYSGVFPEELPPGLPPSREVDHKIELIPGSVPPSRPTFRMSSTELIELKNQLDELLAAGFIQHSKSPYGAPILFVKKKDGSMRMCGLSSTQ